jgi:hypothetical protein
VTNQTATDKQPKNRVCSICGAAYKRGKHYAHDLTASQLALHAAWVKAQQINSRDQIKE